MTTAQAKTAPRKATTRRTPAKKATTRAPAKPTASKPTVRAKAAPSGKVAKPVSTKLVKTTKDDPKAKKPKLVRDSFTIPKAEYEVLKALKERTAKLGRPAKKSELLRAGIKLLAAQGDAALIAAVTAVPAIKTGRPAKNA